MKLFEYLRPHSGHTTEAKLAIQKFDQDELHVLKKTWQDLADRSNGKGIDKDTFLQYFPLHGLLGERLFAQFDSHKRGYIDFDEFITGLATVCRGTLDDKIHFVFNMYDVSHDSTVSKQELSTLLNHIPREMFVHTPHPPVGHGSMNLNTLNKDGIANVDSASESEKGSVAGDVPSVVDASENRHTYEDEVDIWTNQDLVEKAFEDCDINNEGRLTYEAFKMWVQRNPQIMDYIESILPYAGPKDEHPHQHKKETLPHLKRIQSRMSVGRNNHLGEEALSAQRESSGKRNSLGSSTGSGRPRLSTFQHYESGTLSPAPMSPFFHGHISRNSSFSVTSHTMPPPPLVHTQSGTPVNRAPSVDGNNMDSEEQVKILLSHAISISQNAELRTGIQNLIDLHLSQYGDAANTDSLIHLDRRNSTEAYNSIVSLENYLWKKGKSVFHLLSKRYYLLAGNCVYYYAHKDDVRVKGVIFLTGCIIERKKDEEMELRGYFGFDITHQDLCTEEHHRHDKRVLYCRSEEEREKWITALQHAAHVVPIEDDYVLGKELGRGRFSVVCECVHKITNKHCAVKIIDKSSIEPEEKTLLRTEIAVLKLVNHPNIIRLEGLYESKQYIYIVMEMLKGGELFERIVGRPRFSELEAAKLMRPLLESVAYLHDLGIVHRDLKPENILCGDELDDLKIADFGLSKMTLPKEKMDAACGTLSYVAPEVLTMQGYGKEADLWSVGVILFLLLCGKLPFDGEDHNEIIRSTIQADLKVNPNVWNRLSEDAKSMITSLLNKNPKERISARDALKHPFIVNTLGIARRSTLVSPVPPSALMSPQSIGNTPSNFGPSSNGSASVSSPPVLSPAALQGIADAAEAVKSVPPESSG
jgi:serine/threonine protein kinase/Ca2+-binding EF-hand superfamily protein